MNDKDQPAFPVFPDTESGHGSAFRGMALRDYFAAKAMQAFAAKDHWDLEDMANYAYRLADVMLKVREETE